MSVDEKPDVASDWKSLRVMHPCTPIYRARYDTDSPAIQVHEPNKISATAFTRHVLMVMHVTVRPLSVLRLSYYVQLQDLRFADVVELQH